MLGVIGGSGFEKFEDFETVELLNRETPITPNIEFSCFFNFIFF